MGRRPTYSPEYRQQMVELVKAGRSPASLAREYGVSDFSIRAWVRQAAEAEAGGLTVEEKDELKRLRREVAVLRQEKEILKKAAVWFAQESGKGPGESTTS